MNLGSTLKLAPSKNVQANEKSGVVFLDEHYTDAHKLFCYAPIKRGDYSNLVKDASINKLLDPLKS